MPAIHHGAQRASRRHSTRPLAHRSPSVEPPSRIVSDGRGSGPRHQSSILPLRTLLLGLLTVGLALGSFASAAPPAAAAGAPRAVVIVGPTHGSTGRYLDLAENWARSAASQGMEVHRVYHPRATWANVLAKTRGANLVVYLGHGNGWPSPYGPFQEDTKNGFGLNPVEGGSQNSVKYFGGNHVRKSMRLAPNAVVVLSHACYSAGFGETGQANPSESVAKQRVDNFAAAFLKVGAGAVFAYDWEQSIDLPRALMTTHKTMDQLFQTKGTRDHNGFVGWRNKRFASSRTPGAQLHLDPHPQNGYLRALSGDLGLTTDEWRTGAPPAPEPSEPADTAAPELTAVTAAPAGTTSSTGEGARPEDPPTFTPNGDGAAETLSVRTAATEPSHADVAITDQAGTQVRKLSVWSDTGRHALTWDGRTAGGELAPEGTYTIAVTPRDRAGNVGAPRSVSARLLRSLSRQTVAKPTFYARDGDSLARVATFSANLAVPAKVTWKIVDAGGRTVRTHRAGADTPAGNLTWAWNGRNDAGTFLANGRYHAVLSATTEAGTLTYRTGVVQRSFLVKQPFTSAARGRKYTWTFVSTEPLKANPRLTITQPGIRGYTVRTYATGTPRTYRAIVTLANAGRSGTGVLVVRGVDTKGGTQSHRWTLPIR